MGGGVWGGGGLRAGVWAADRAPDRALRVRSPAGWRAPTPPARSAASPPTTSPRPAPDPRAEGPVPLRRAGASASVGRLVLNACMEIKPQIVIDCPDPAELASFWAGALEYEMERPPQGFAT